MKWRFWHSVGFFHEIVYTHEPLTLAQSYIPWTPAWVKIRSFPLCLSHPLLLCLPISILFLCVSISLLLSQSLSNLAASRFPGKDTRKDILARITVQFGAQYLPTIFPSTIQNTIGVQKEILCRNSFIPTQAIHHTLFLLSNFQGELLTTSCNLRFTWFQNLTQRSKYFQPHSH